MWGHLGTAMSQVSTRIKIVYHDFRAKNCKEIILTNSQKVKKNSRTLFKTD